MHYMPNLPKGNVNNASACYTLRVQTGTASKEGNPGIENIRLMVYPSPAKDVLEVRVDGQVRKADIQVIDMSGRVVMRNVMMNNLKQLNVSRLVPGMYILTINDNGIIDEADMNLLLRMFAVRSGDGN